MSTREKLVCATAEVPYLERVQYFTRQLITPEDMIQEQEYFRNKLRRHNRFLHGWGVVCGARIKQGREDCEIIIEPGYILGPHGDEIVIESEVTVNLCKGGDALNPCGEMIDPWCNDVSAGCQADQPLYVAIRYSECQTRPVRVFGGGCGCDESDCQYSRIRDSYVIKVLTQLPDSYNPMPTPDLGSALLCRHGREGGACRLCSPCPAEPWVILADVQLTKECRIAKIDCFTHRRYVATFADYYCRCNPAVVPPDDPPEVEVPSFSTFAGGRSSVIDQQAEGEETPASNLLLRREDNSWMSLPVHFTAKAGDTIASLLAREGERSYYDAASGETFTLREIYALSGADTQAQLEDTGAALAPLEGQRLKLSDLRAVRAGLELLLDTRGVEQWDKNFGGSPAAVDKLPVTSLKSVSTRSLPGTKLSALTIADLAAMPRADFLAETLENVPDARRKEVEQKAAEIWTRATRVANLSQAWRE